jgi:hypothetical protein
MDRLISVRTSIGLAVIAIVSSGTAFAQNSNPPDTTVRDQLIVRFKTCCLEAAFISSQPEPRLKAEHVRIKIDLKKIIVQ